MVTPMANQGALVDIGKILQEMQLNRREDRENLERTLQVYIKQMQQKFNKFNNNRNHSKERLRKESILGANWCDPNKAYSLGQRLGPNHAQGPIHGPHAPSSPSPSRGPLTRGMLKKSNWASFKMGQTHMDFSYSSHGPKKMWRFEEVSQRVKE